MSFKVTILTSFPEMFPGPLGCSLAGKALKNNIWSLNLVNLRDFGLTKHKNIDDTAYGGGNGLIMRPDVLGAALDSVIVDNYKTKIYYPSPRGIPFSQSVAKEIVKEKEIIILCGRYEGIDERVIDEYNTHQISMGDYILSGGELAAMTILDSVIRLKDGVLANRETLVEESFEQESHGIKLIEHPLYTKPAVWRDRKVPEILMSGHHAEITEWKKKESLRITKERMKLLESRLSK